MDLDDPGGQLKQRRRLEVHFPDEPDDEWVVPERQLVQAAQEDQAVRENGQPVGMEVEDLELFQLANAV